MAFTFNNYATNQLSKSPLNDMISNMFGGYEQGVKSRFLKPSLQEELKKAQLFNQYYGPNMESQMGLQNAQTGQAKAHTGLLGEQTRGAQIENQYMPKKLQAAIAESQANAQKANLLQMIRAQMFGGQIQGGQNQTGHSSFGNGDIPAQSSGMNGGQEIMPQQMTGNRPSPNIPENQMGNQNGFNTNLDYGKAATAMQALGLGKPHVVEANGSYIAITPFGNFDTGVSGLSARDKQLAVQDAKKISALEDQALSGYQKQETFNELNKDLGSNEFEAVRQNPALGRHELAWFDKFGTKDQQEMIGRMRTHMGEIIKNSSRDFAGQFRVGEQALLNSMKPNESDSLSVMKGKAEALTFMNELLTKRSEREADLMRNYNMSALQARVMANKEINPSMIKEQIKSILHSSNKPQISAEEARAELEKRRSKRGI